MEHEKLIDYMQLAISEAELALQKNEVPVGAIVVFENKIIGRGHNLTESLHDATAHAEIIALTAAYEHFKDWRLENCWLFSTLEPCAMCAGAATLSRINKIVYGCKDAKFGGCESIFEIPTEKKLNHQAEIISGICADEISEMMKFFFQKLRKEKKRIH